MMAGLSGLHIIVTRPLAQAEPWAKHLRALGASVSLVPLLDILPVQNDQQVQDIKNYIINIDHYAKVIFVSQNAVVHGLDWLDHYWPQLPSAINFFAVGETTARLMLERDLKVTDLAQTQRGAMTSETLLQAEALQQVCGEKILIMRGLGGRTQLGDVLAERGAIVHYCELYERRLPAHALETFTQALLIQATLAQHNNRLQQPVVVTLQSGESLENLITVLQRIQRDAPVLHQQIESLTHTQQLILLVPSQRVAEQAIAFGFKVIAIAENATEASMQQQLFAITASLKP
jgi:uroporphyrinogen-III synthase